MKKRPGKAQTIKIQFQPKCKNFQDAIRKESFSTQEMEWAFFDGKDVIFQIDFSPTDKFFSLTSRRCYKTFLKEIQKIQISHLTESTRIDYFKSNKQFWSMLENSIVFIFQCRFRHHHKLFAISQFWGNLDFLQKSFITLTTEVKNSFSLFKRSISLYICLFYLFYRIQLFKCVSMILCYEQKCKQICLSVEINQSPLIPDRQLQGPGGCRGPNWDEGSWPVFAGERTLEECCQVPMTPTIPMSHLYVICCDGGHLIRFSRLAHVPMSHLHICQLL